MAVYVKGDVHGYLDEIINFIDRFQLNETDTIIVLGDMGLYWDKKGKYAENFIKNYEQDYKTNIIWIDGNHENFDLIDKFEADPATGIVKCSEHISYIPRGTVFNIEVDGQTKTCLACGGADSVDKFRRIKHLTWWEQEQIRDEDIENAIRNSLDKHIDYVFTHCCPHKIFMQYAPWLITLLGIDRSIIDHTSEQQLEKLMDSIDFDQWYFAHYHIDKRLDEHFVCLFQDFVRL